MKQKGEGSGKKSYEKELPTLKGYLLENRKVSPKPFCILMTAFTLSVEYARFINMIYVKSYNYIVGGVIFQNHKEKEKNNPKEMNTKKWHVCRWKFSLSMCTDIHVLSYRQNI